MGTVVRQETNEYGTTLLSFEDYTDFLDYQKKEREQDALDVATDRAKESEVEDYKVIKKVAKFFSDNKFEEASAEFAKVRELYNQLAD